MSTEELLLLKIKLFIIISLANPGIRSWKRRDEKMLEDVIRTYTMINVLSDVQVGKLITLHLHVNISACFFEVGKLL